MSVTINSKNCFVHDNQVEKFLWQNRINGSGIDVWKFIQSTNIWERVLPESAPNPVPGTPQKNYKVRQIWEQDVKEYVLFEVVNGKPVKLWIYDIKAGIPDNWNPLNDAKDDNYKEFMLTYGEGKNID